MTDRRRGVHRGLGSAAAWPAVALAQQAVMPVNGFLSTISDFDLGLPFLQGLKETGHVEEQTWRRRPIRLLGWCEIVRGLQVQDHE